MNEHQQLTDEDRAIYEWQMWSPGFGELGQEKLKNASVLVSRCGGLGGMVAYELAAAGIGKLVLAHAGNVKPSDLNRQLLMTHEALGTSRMACARQRLLDLNPRLKIETFEENISEANADHIVGLSDIVVDCAPMFEERFAMNRAAMQQEKPVIECAMYDMEAQLTTFLPSKPYRLEHLYPETPPGWKREFPVFGAVSAAVGCLGAMEAIKVIAGVGSPLVGRLLVCDLRTMTFRQITLQRPGADGTPSVR